MTTNQTQIISSNDLVTAEGSINAFIQSIIPNGCTNFDIRKAVVTTEYSGGNPTGGNIYTIQVNYYDPGVMG